MNIKKQVTSLETSKKLKELGVEQESIFFWIQTYDSTLAPILNHSIARTPDVRGDLYLVDKSPNGRNYSAFTASELIEILISLGRNFLPYFCDNPREMCWVYNFGPYPDYVRADTLVECLAKMLIHLKENKLI